MFFVETTNPLPALFKKLPKIKKKIKAELEQRQLTLLDENFFQ